MRNNGLEKVRHIVAVSSCKGGVGKSTVATNLAFSLSKTGAKVGLFDADVYGPSLPTMVNLADYTIGLNENQLISPLVAYGVKLQSFGYSQESTGQTGAAIMRGPMVSQVINQLLTGTEWGELDYLIIDMPPGTGDIQLTIGQLVGLTAAVIVTTPQKLSFVDVVKGIQMFDKLRVPTVAVVENMSYFICGNCSEKHEFFGRGALRSLKEEFGFTTAIALPIDPAISPAGDAGHPVVLTQKAPEVTAQFKELAEQVRAEIDGIAGKVQKPPQVSFDPKTGIVFSYDNQVRIIEAFKLRKQCRCASCVDEITGDDLTASMTIQKDIAPEDITTVGNYALGINWSDGHASLYPYAQILGTPASK